MSIKKYSKQDCIESLQKAAEILGESPSRRNYDELSISPSSDVVKDRFGSWNSAKENAGLEIYERDIEKFEDGIPEVMDYTEEDFK